MQESGKCPTGDPINIGVLLFPQYEILDIAGPLEAWTCLARSANLNNLTLVTVAAKAGEVSSAPYHGATSKLGENFGMKVDATHSFDDCPALDVLLVPGGLGAGDCTYEPPAVGPAVKFIQKVFPSLKYLITVCTGAGLAARAGVLDGCICTTNKNRWLTVSPLGPKTYWEAKARWVESGNGKVWTTSGVSAGTDGVIAWISKVYSDAIAESACLAMEYERQRNSKDDPFAEKNGCKDIPPQS